MDATLQILQTLQNDPTIQNILIKHNNKQLLETTSDPAGVIRSIVKSIVNIHTRIEKELAEKLQKSGQEKAEMGNDLKIERSKQRYSISSESDKLKRDLAEAHKATESVKAELSKIQLSDTKVQELKDEIIQAKKVYEETTANIQEYRNELERLRSSSPAGNILDFPAQIARKQGEMDALIEQNRALEQKISYYSNVIKGKFRKSPEYQSIISSIKQI
jgi:DNA repair exonuclease SbcCD ATPase subunit